MDNNNDTENSKYRLLGFEKNKNLVIIMVISTGKTIKLKLEKVLGSEIIDNLNKTEIKDIYRKYYSDGTALTTYEMNDRHERSWLTYVALNLFLFALYMFTNIAATKLIYIKPLDIVVTPGVFIYPLTFLLVDILNESYGLKLARRAILFAFISNAFIITLLSATTYLPGLPGWKLDEPYDVVISHTTSVLIASCISFLFSEYANSYLLCKIKELTNSNYLFLRVFFSTFFAVIIDSLIFCFIAFYGTMDNSDILKIIYIQIAIKMFFAVFNILPAYGARSLFKKYISAPQTA